MFSPITTYILQRIEDVGAEDSIIPEKLVRSLKIHKIYFVEHVVAAFQMVSICCWRRGVSSRLPHWESLRNVHCPRIVHHQTEGKLQAGQAEGGGKRVV